MEIEARYEYRFFSPDLQEAWHKIQTLSEQGEARRSEEIYLVSDPLDDHNYKIRDGKIDLKVLRQKKGDLEQWYPEFKGEFPLHGNLLEKWIWPLTGQEGPPFPQGKLTLEEFLDCMAGSYPRVRTVPVSKNRYQQTIRGCTVEFATVKIGGTDLQSIAIESTDPGQVLQIRAEIGMEKQENINYVKAIKRWERR